MRRQTAQEIDEEAANWAAKVDRGLSAAEETKLEQWLAGDVRRAGAFGMMRAVALQTERAAALGPQVRQPTFGRMRQPAPSRRAVLLTGGLAAASAAMAVFGWPIFRAGRSRTRKGEVRQLALEDGSVVTLNTDSQVEVRMSESRREVRLRRGEALFDVAHDKARPFVVAAGDTEATAVGTSFTVRKLPGEAVQVLVREGVVDVTRRDIADHSRRRLFPNMRAISTNGPATDVVAGALSVTSVPANEVQRALAWRTGQLAFEGETLAAAAMEFARYSDTRIVVEDPGLAREEIAGLYQATDPIGFAESAAASLNARTQVSEGEVRIFR